MKPIFYLFLFLSSLKTFAQTKPTILTFEEKWTKDKHGDLNMGKGKQNNVFTLKGNNDYTVHIEARVPKTPKDPKATGIAGFTINCYKTIPGGTDELVREIYFYGPMKDKDQIKYEGISIHEAGDYVIKYFDPEHPEKILASTTFKVLPASNPIAPQGKAVVTLCDDVDNKGKPIGVKSSINAGDCANFSINFSKEENLYLLGWVVYTIGEDGKDDKFIDQISQNVGGDGSGGAGGFTKPIKWAFVEKLCFFPDPGKYRVYAIDYYKREQFEHNGNLPEYFGKIEVNVK